ncbi:MAG: hypothetical protein ACREQQ_01800, partial [Candidatus Binatia bacterium]
GEGGGSPSSASVVVSEGTYHRLAIHRGPFKFIRDGIADRNQLFDLSRDPDETAPVESLLADVGKQLEALIDGYFAVSTDLRSRLAVTSEAAPLDAKKVEALRALGYVH